MIIDANAQFGPGLRTDSPLRPRLDAATADGLVGILDRCGMAKAVVHAPRWLGGTQETDFVDPNYVVANSVIGEGTKRYPTRLIGLARVNPKYGREAVAELTKCLDTYGFRGLFLDAAAEGFRYDDVELLMPLFAVCADRGVPVMAFTWQAPFQAFQLLYIAEAFPTVNVIIAHSGWRTGSDAVIAAERAANLYFESSFGGAGIVTTVARRLGAERVVFGSSAPFGLPEVEIERVRRFSKLTEPQLELVLGGNAARLVGVAA